MASASYPYEEEEGIVNLYTGFEEYEASREAKARNAERHSAADWEAGWDEDERSVEEDFDDDVEEPLPPQPPKKKAKAPQQEDAVICTRITDGPTLPPVRAVQLQGLLACAARLHSRYSVGRELQSSY